MLVTQRIQLNTHREDCHARQHLGLTFTTTYAWHPRKEHPVRDNTWG